MKLCTLNGRRATLALLGAAVVAALVASGCTGNPVAEPAAKSQEIVQAPPPAPVAQQQPASKSGSADKVCDRSRKILAQIPLSAEEKRKIEDELRERGCPDL